MDKPQIAELLALAAAYDQRTIGASDVEAWHLVLADVSYMPARQAVVDHYRECRDRVMPADVARRVRGYTARRPCDYPAIPVPSRPDQAEINERGRRMVLAALAGRQGPLAGSVRDVVESAGQVESEAREET